MIEELEFLEPDSLQEAAALLAQYGDEAKAIAGGQTLIPMLWQRLLTPRYLVSLRGINELKSMEKHRQGSLRIGAGVTHGMIESSQMVREEWPLLAETVAKIAAPQIRNLGTLAGDLCHSDYGADPPASLLVLEARARISGTGGDRWAPLDNFFLEMYGTALAPDEVLSEIEVPAIPDGAATAYVKYSLRAMDPAILGIAVMLSLKDGRCQEVRIGLNGASPVPFRARLAEQALKGWPLDDAHVNEAARLAQEQAEPISDSHASAEYRGRMINVFVKRALRLAEQRVGQ